MAILPVRIQDLLDFCHAHYDIWQGTPGSIGLTSDQIDAFKAAIEAADTAHNAHNAAVDAARAAGTTSRAAIGDLRQSASDLIRSIKAYASNQSSPSTVYAAAQIPEPATPGPTPPPGTPTNFEVGLLEDGTLTLKWKCPNPSGTSGTIYEVMRQIGSGGSMSYVGSTGVRSFEDPTVPAGSTAVTYRVTAVRSTQRGNPAQFTVRFGVGGGGGMAIASVEESTPMRMAA